MSSTQDEVWAKQTTWDWGQFDGVREAKDRIAEGWYTQPPEGKTTFYVFNSSGRVVMKETIDG
tara:strand:+ start:115 stop:303 length:189 start_codon:yes stop_codon:yes gene_type:complete